MASLLSGHGILPIAVYVLGLIFRPHRRILRISVRDSLAVFVPYAIGIAGLAEDDRPDHSDPYVGRRRAGDRPCGWAGASRTGGGGIGRVTGSSGARVTAAPWWVTSSGAPWSRA
jgi:hypothetical protein